MRILLDWVRYCECTREKATDAEQVRRIRRSAGTASWILRILTNALQRMWLLRSIHDLMVSFTCGDPSE